MLEIRDRKKKYHEKFAYIFSGFSNMCETPISLVLVFTTKRKKNNKKKKIKTSYNFTLKLKGKVYNKLTNTL